MVNREYEKLNTIQQDYYNVFVNGMKEHAVEFLFDENADRMDIFDSYTAAIFDNPQFFWYSRGIDKWDRMDGKIKVVPKFETDSQQEKICEQDELFNAYVDEIVNRAKKYDDEYDRILFIHNYLVYNTEYYDSLPNRYNAYGAIVEHKAVCAGYAAAFKVLLNKLDIECGIIHGKTERSDDIGHAWNYAKINGEYCFFDTTWDDPNFNNSINRPYEISYDYFAINIAELSRTHTVEDKLFVPNCNSNELNYYNHFGFVSVAYDFERVKKVLSHQAVYRKDVRIRFGSYDELMKAKSDLLNKGRLRDLPFIGNKNVDVYTDEKFYVMTFVI